MTVELITFYVVDCSIYFDHFLLSGLPCGKEGPMIHSGAALGAGIPEVSLLCYTHTMPFS